MGVSGDPGTDAGTSRSHPKAQKPTQSPAPLGGAWSHGPPPRDHPPSVSSSELWGDPTPCRAGLGVKASTLPSLPAPPGRERPEAKPLPEAQKGLG